MLKQLVSAFEHGGQCHTAGEECPGHARADARAPDEANVFLPLLQALHTGPPHWDLLAACQWSFVLRFPWAGLERVSMYQWIGGSEFVLRFCQKQRPAPQWLARGLFRFPASWPHFSWHGVLLSYTLASG